jgi:acetyltransferase-like isoleucine patch superfamily enzyme
MKRIGSVVVWLLVSVILVFGRLKRTLGLERLGAAMRSEYLRRRLQRPGNQVSVGRGLRVGRRVHVAADPGAVLQIGDNVVLGDDAYVHVFRGATLVLGNGVHVNTHARISAFVSVELGDQSGLAAFSAIHDHHHRFDLKSPWDKRDYEGAPVKIGTGVAILARVAITEGVTIGDFAVVGANSVVTRDIPARTFCGGVPARVIRQGNS